MNVGMDLNASPEPEEDEQVFEPTFSQDSGPKEKHIPHHHHHQLDHVESAVDIMRRVLHSVFNYISRIKDTVFMIHSPS